MSEKSEKLKWSAKWAPKFLIDHAQKAGLNPNTCFIGFIAAWTLFFIILFIPTPEGMRPSAQKAAAVIVWAVTIWISSAMPVAVSGVVACLLLFITGAQPTVPRAFAGFALNESFLVLGAFVFAGIMVTLNLHKKIALWILFKLRATTVNRTMIGLAPVNTVLGLAVPAAAARGATLLPIVNGFNELFEDTPEGKRARAALAITGICWFPMVAGILILTAHMPNVVLVGVFDKALGYKMGWGEWLWLHWPIIGTFPIMYWVMKWSLKTSNIDIPGGMGMISGQLTAMGKLTKSEKMVILILCIAIILWATGQWHKLPTGIVAMIAVGLLFIPGVLPATFKEISSHIPWGIWILLCGALSVSAAIIDTGLGDWVAVKVAYYILDYHWFLKYAIIAFTTTVLRLFILSNVAAITMAAPILVSLAKELNLEPISFTLLIANYDTFSFMLPTQVTACVIAYGTATFTFGRFFRIGLPLMILIQLWFIFIMMPWYAFNGYAMWAGYSIPVIK